MSHNTRKTVVFSELSTHLNIHVFTPLISQSPWISVRLDFSRESNSEETWLASIFNSTIIIFGGLISNYSIAWLWWRFHIHERFILSPLIRLNTATNNSLSDNINFTWLKKKILALYFLLMRYYKCYICL